MNLISFIQKNSRYNSVQQCYYYSDCVGLWRIFLFFICLKSMNSTASKKMIRDNLIAHSHIGYFV